MSIEDPFAQIRDGLGNQVRLLRNPVVGKDDPFINGYDGYTRNVQPPKDATMVVESWPTSGGVIQRICSFVGGKIQRASILYPLTTRGHDPNLDYIGFSASYDLRGAFSVGKLGQALVYRSRGKDIYDVAEYDEQGAFASLRLSVQVDKSAPVTGVTEILAIDTALMVNRQVIDQEGVAIFDDSLIRGQLFAGENMVVIRREDSRANQFDEIAIPSRFNQERVGALLLGSDVNLLYDQYPAQYYFSQTPMVQTMSEVAEELTQKLPQAELNWSCIRVCLVNGWMPTKADVTRLVRLRDGVKKGNWSEQGLSRPRLEFYRWLVTQGRLSDNLAI